MQKKQREYEESQVLDTVRQFGEEGPKGFAGTIPKACYNVMLHEIKAEEKVKRTHPKTTSPLWKKGSRSVARRFRQACGKGVPDNP